MNDDELDRAAREADAKIPDEDRADLMAVLQHLVSAQVAGETDVAAAAGLGVERTRYLLNLGASVGLIGGAPRAHLS